MAIAKQDILDAIGSMTVLELSQLIKDMEEKFGVSAAAAVAVAGPAAGGAAAAAPKEEKTEFTVMLNAAGDNKVNVIKGGAMPNVLMTAKEVGQLASMPSREQLLATLMGTMQAPVAKLVRTMNEVPSKFVRTLAALRDQREKSGTA